MISVFHVRSYSINTNKLYFCNILYLFFYIYRQDYEPALPKAWRLPQVRLASQLLHVKHEWLWCYTGAICLRRYIHPLQATARLPLPFLTIFDEVIYIYLRKHHKVYDYIYLFKNVFITDIMEMYKFLIDNISHNNKDYASFFYVWTQSSLIKKILIKCLLK